MSPRSPSVSQTHAGVDASVLVPVRNEARGLADTVAAMRAQRFAGTVELLLIDGRSEDDTRAVAAGLSAVDGRIRVLDNPNATTPHALNVGLRHARGEFVVRMDAHTFYPPDYIARGIERLRRGDVDWVCGPQIPHGTGAWSRRVALALSTRLGAGASRKWGRVGDAAEPASGEEFELDTGVFGGVWRRDFVAELGGWDGEWAINQDSELAARVLERGGRIVCLPELGARYVPRDSLRGLARQYWRYGAYRAKTARRHPDSLRASLLLSPAVATAALAAVLPSPIRGLARGAVGLYGATVAAVSAQAAADAGVRDAAALPAVFATMHLAWGAGFIAGCARFGPPLGAIAALARPRGQRPAR